MIFKYSLLAIVLLQTCAQVYTSGADTETSQLIAKLLESFQRDNFQISRSPSPRRYLNTEESTQQRVKPIAAPPPAPALGSFEEPVAWPYPPAPKDLGNSEFPLLERFLKSNGGQTSYQNNQINTGSQWSERQREPERKPTPTSAPNHWGNQNSGTTAPQYLEWGVPQKSQSTQSSQEVTKAPQYMEWGVPQKSQSSSSSSGITPEVPKIIQWDVPKKNEPSLSSERSAHPPLDPNENFYIQHTGQRQGQNSQPKHFSLNTLRPKEPEQSLRDKLNVSFIMPPDIRPLSLNFDTGEVQIDFGDDKGRRVPIPAEALGPSARQYRSQISLDQIFGTQGPKNAKIQELPPQLLSSAPRQQDNNQGKLVQPINIQATGSHQKDEDEEYIIVRHDMNKYAYDLPKGLSLGSNVQALSSGLTHTQPQIQQLLPTNIPSVGTSGGQPKTQTQTVEKYDVSGQKNLHFVLGRVSG